MTAVATRTGEPRLGSWASWAVLMASFGLSASTWIALARVAGFTDTVTIPAVGVTLALAWLMPVAVDGYVVVALVLWMAPVPPKVASFARKNTYLAASVGIAAQSAYHLLFTLSTNAQAWRVVLAAIVGALPPLVAGLAVHMRALLRRESSTTAPAQVTNPTPAKPTLAAARTGETSADPSAATAPTPAPSGMDIQARGPVPNPAPALVPAPVPTPAVVAARITSTRPTPTGSATPPRRGIAASRTPMGSPHTPARPLAPPTTDMHVPASGAAQPSPPTVSPELLTEAHRVASDYHTEHGTPITAGQLAVRLKVTSELAGHLLTVPNPNPNHPNPRPVNGATITTTSR